MSTVQPTTNKRSRPFRLLARTSLLSAIVAGAILTGGCGSVRNCSCAGMKLKPADSDQTLLQKFDTAVASKDETGETDIVLSDSRDGMDQVMHLRVLWKPMRGTKTDQPSTTNTVIDWYVTAKSTSGPAESLRYTGAGFVTTSRGRNGQLWVSVKSASMKLAARRGTLVDPVGPATMQGGFYAKMDAAEVKSLLASVKEDRRPAVAGAPAKSNPN